jgi:hypothetical protein
MFRGISGYSERRVQSNLEDALFQSMRSQYLAIRALPSDWYGDLPIPIRIVKHAEHLILSGTASSIDSVAFVMDALVDQGQTFQTWFVDSDEHPNDTVNLTASAIAKTMSDLRLSDAKGPGIIRVGLAPKERTLKYRQDTAWKNIDASWDFRNEVISKLVQQEGEPALKGMGSEEWLRHYADELDIQLSIHNDWGEIEWSRPSTSTGKENSVELVDGEA